MDEQDRNQENLTDSENFEREEQHDVHQDLQESQKEDASFSSEKVEAADAEKETSSENTDNVDVTLVDGMRPEFKEAMDSYEEFYEEYCEVLKQYMEDPTDLAVLTQYSDLMQQSIEMAEKFEEWDNGELNTEELKYYVEVNGRVTQMLVEASGQ